MSLRGGAVHGRARARRNGAELQLLDVRAGRTLLSFVPASQFTLERGEDATADYLFNKHRIHHLFCRTCGIKSFARGVRRDGQPTVAVNVRCLDGFEPGQFKITEFDGRSL